MRNIRRGPETEGSEQGRPSTIELDAANENPGARQSSKSPSPAIPKRWVPHRKAEVVAAISGGFLSLEEARDRYSLSIEEFLAWQHGIKLFGLAGLRVYGSLPHRRSRTKLDGKTSEGRKHRRAADLLGKSR
jgi:hypothetical protein